jgi:hypothetical protein
MRRDENGEMTRRNENKEIKSGRDHRIVETNKQYTSTHRQSGKGWRDEKDSPCMDIEEERIV